MVPVHLNIITTTLLNCGWCGMLCGRDGLWSCSSRSRWNCCVRNSSARENARKKGRWRLEMLARDIHCRGQRSTNSSPINDKSKQSFKTECRRQQGRPFPRKQPPPLLSPFSAFFRPSSFLLGARRYDPRENFGIKDSCRRVTEHFRHKHQLNFVSLNFLIFIHQGFPWCYVGGMPLDAVGGSPCAH